MRTLLILRSMMLTAVLLAGLMVKPPAVTASSPFILAPGERQFTVGYFSACAIDTSHHLYCWGDNSSGATIGLKESVQFSQVPRRVGKAKWRSVYGNLTVCGIQWDYSVWCWGHAGMTGLSVNNKYRSLRFTPQLLTTRASISVERVHPNVGMCIRDRKQQLWCRLDDDSFYVSGWRLISSTPVREASFIRDGEMCFLTTTDLMKCWGKNLLGVFPTGLGTPVFVKKPRSVVGTFQSLFTYRQGSCALGTDGFQKCWGKKTGYPRTVPTRVAESWIEDHGVPCVDGLCVITPTKIEEVQWKNLWADQCGTLLDGEVSCVHEIEYPGGDTVATLTSNDPFTDVKLEMGVGCGSKQDRTLWCWGLQDFSTDSVSGPRTFGRDESDYATSPVLVMRP